VRRFDFKYIPFAQCSLALKRCVRIVRLVDVVWCFTARSREQSN